MTSSLKGRLEIWKLARDLGLDPKGDPLSQIVRYCTNRVSSFVKEYPCTRLCDLLQVVAAKLDTLFLEIHDDNDLQRIKRDYLQKGELAFADLEHQLGPATYAITFRRIALKPGDRRFVSVIDCRGDKLWRSYFSKWHELAHLLTITPQMRLKFCRTHVIPEKKDPEETAMDVIAGEIGFRPQLVGYDNEGQISFEKLNELRQDLCPQASFVASVIGFVKAWPFPCVLVDAGLGYRKSEKRLLAQEKFAFAQTRAAPQLRALHVNPNESARELGIIVYPNMRIPESSVIHKVFSNGLREAEAVENLRKWKTSGGQRLRDREVFIEVRKNNDGVLALITPL